MKTIALTFAALIATATAAKAQGRDGQAVSDAFWGKWSLNARTCDSTGDLRHGQIMVDEVGYTSDGERNAAVTRRVSGVRNRATYDVIFSAIGDREWRGRMTLRRIGARLGVTNGRNAERVYVRCMAPSVSIPNNPARSS